MVLANYKPLTEHLNVNHLRLVMERLWAECNLGFGDTYPDFMDAIMPLASLPVEIAGRNRMQRELVAKLLKWILNGKRVHCTTKSRSVWSNWSLMFMVKSTCNGKNQQPKRRSRGNVR
jgi:homoserine O-acetyltransferase